MTARTNEQELAAIAAAIAEPARASMLCALLDQRARTATELATLAEIAPSTASSHLSKLREQGLVSMVAQGKHRYFQLQCGCANVLEALLNLAPRQPARFKLSTPSRLQERGLVTIIWRGNCGGLARSLYATLVLQVDANDTTLYHVSEEGIAFFTRLGVDCTTPNKSRRRFVCACLDWSERRPHLGGAFGAHLLHFFC